MDNNKSYINTNSDWNNHPFMKIQPSHLTSTIHIRRKVKNWGVFYCSYNFPLMKRLWSYTKHTYTRNYGSFQLSDQDQILKRNEIINKIFPFHLSPRKFIYLILELTTWAFARTAWKTFESDVCTTQNYKILKTGAKNVSYLTKMLNWKIFACFN